jgi:hypothetical protein
MATIEEVPAGARLVIRASGTIRNAPRTERQIRDEALKHAACIAHGKEAAYTRYGQPAKASAAAAIAKSIKASIAGGV